MNFKFIFSLFFVFLIVVVLFFGGCNYNKFESVVPLGNELSEESSFEESDLTWDFPLQYGKPGWDALKTAEEQINAYNIPNEILNRISTEELVKVCLNIIEYKNANLLENKRGEVNHFKAYMRSDNKMFLDSIVELLENFEL